MSITRRALIINMILTSTTICRVIAMEDNASRTLEPQFIQTSRISPMSDFLRTINTHIDLENQDAIITILEQIPSIDFTTIALDSCYRTIFGIARNRNLTKVLEWGKKKYPNQNIKQCKTLDITTIIPSIAPLEEPDSTEKFIIALNNQCATQ